jgi:transposase
VSGLYCKTFKVTLGQVTQVADPFHLVRLANTKLDECRRRVQNDTMGPPGPERRRALPGPAAANQDPRAPSNTVATPSCGA